MAAPACAPVRVQALDPLSPQQRRQRPRDPSAPNPGTHLSTPPVHARPRPGSDADSVLLWAGDSPPASLGRCKKSPQLPFPVGSGHRGTQVTGRSASRTVG